MQKSYKTEINPTPKQIQIINKTIGICRYVYNFYLAYNKKRYEKDKKFTSGIDFSKWLNRIYIPQHPEYQWIKKVSSKSVKQSIMHAEKAFEKFLKKQSEFPKFKKKNKSDIKMYFVKTDKKTIILCERHRIKIPALGWVRLKEKGYLPANPNTHLIKSGSICCKAGKYYISILAEEKETKKPQPYKFGSGIDLDIKEFAVMSNGIRKKNKNQTQAIKKLEKQLKREQRCLSRKYEDKKKHSRKKGEATRQNIQKQMLKVQKLHQRIDSIYTNFINQCVSKIVKTKPSYIAIENLNVSGMMKNWHLSKTVALQKFYEFCIKLKNKCEAYGIALRITDDGIHQANVAINMNI